MEKNCLNCKYYISNSISSSTCLHCVNQNNYEPRKRTSYEDMWRSLAFETFLPMKKRLDVDVRIKDVVFNDPATIVFWSDGTKTVVKTQNNETFDPEKGLAMAISKKALGNKGNYFNEIRKWIDKSSSDKSGE